MTKSLLAPLLLVSVTAAVTAQNILLTNDDGWAVAIIRAQLDSLDAAGYSVILSAPAENESGTGSSTATPTALNQECEFNTCPVGSPAMGNNASDTRENYVNAFPLDAAKFGVQTLAPQFFGGAPDFIVSGPNVGNNLGATVNVSGTVGAACEGSNLGVPSVAFSASGSSISQSSYTTLTSSPISANTVNSLLYASLTTKFVNVLLSSSASPLVPPGTILNVNYPTISSSCNTLEDFQFVFSRVATDSSATDVETCGGDHLPTETTVVGSGCFVSVSVLNATVTSKEDVDAATQALALNSLQALPFTCL